MKKQIFSDQIVAEYKEEMLLTYGAFVDDAEAQIQLGTLVRTLFPTAIAEQMTESRKPLQMDGTVVCSGLLSVKIGAGGIRKEVGASITPTSGQLKKNSYGK